MITKRTQYFDIGHVERETYSDGSEMMILTFKDGSEASFLLRAPIAQKEKYDYFRSSYSGVIYRVPQGRNTPVEVRCTGGWDLALAYDIDNRAALEDREEVDPCDSKGVRND